MFRGLLEFLGFITIVDDLASIGDPSPEPRPGWHGYHRTWPSVLAWAVYIPLAIVLWPHISDSESKLGGLAVWVVVFGVFAPLFLTFARMRGGPARPQDEDDLE